MCVLKYVLNCEQHFTFQSGLSDILVNCNQISKGFTVHVSVFGAVELKLILCR
jgi:hypothetical protein